MLSAKGGRGVGLREETRVLKPAWRRTSFDTDALRKDFRCVCAAANNGSEVNERKCLR